MLDDALTPNPEAVLDVSALTRLIKRQIEGRFTRIWVRGEVSNLRRQSSGHVYFSLKDAGSQLPCVLFARDAAAQSLELADSMELLLFGDLSLYEPHGRYQLVVKIAIRSGEGRLQLEYERLKRRLAAEGLFDAERKKALPVLPKKIAVITSPSGAAVSDFLRILKRRGFCGSVTIFPARVQGKDASKEICAMLEHANASADFDLIVLTRGGGSIEDLWAFNEESLARAVAASHLPVISAVGHEIDHVLSDYAADQRAETPSGAAELISSLFLAAHDRTRQASLNLESATNLRLQQTAQELRELTNRLQLTAPDRQVERLSMRMDDLENRLNRASGSQLQLHRNRLEALSRRLLERHPQHRVNAARQTLTFLAIRLKRAKDQNLLSKSNRIQQLEQRLQNSSLQATLDRGYAVLQAADGRILSDVESASAEKSMIARLRDGQITLRNDT